jgi:hypothetical protein
MVVLLHYLMALLKEFFPHTGTSPYLGHLISEMLNRERLHNFRTPSMRDGSAQKCDAHFRMSVVDAQVVTIGLMIRMVECFL